MTPFDQLTKLGERDFRVHSDVYFRWLGRVSMGSGNEGVRSQGACQATAKCPSAELG